MTQDDAEQIADRLLKANPSRPALDEAIAYALMNAWRAGTKEAGEELVRGLWKTLSRLGVEQ